VAADAVAAAGPAAEAAGAAQSVAQIAAESAEAAGAVSAAAEPPAPAAGVVAETAAAATADPAPQPAIAAQRPAPPQRVNPVPAGALGAVQPPRLAPQGGGAPALPAAGAPAAAAPAAPVPDALTPVEPPPPVVADAPRPPAAPPAVPAAAEPAVPSAAAAAAPPAAGVPSGLAAAPPDAAPAADALPPPPPVIVAGDPPPEPVEQAPETVEANLPERLVPDAARPATPGVITARLPRIESAPPAPAPAQPQPEATQVAEAAPTPRLPGTAPAPILDRAEVAEAAEGAPIDRFARPFDNPDGKPRLAIVLIDTGGPSLDRTSLAALPFPVTFALDPMAPEAALAATVYRDAGQEVVMLATGLPKGATAADVEVTFAAQAETMPEAVAVLDLPEGGFQGNRAVATLAVPVIAGQGRGVLSWDRGLNAADQVARREGVRSATIFRRLDGAGEDEATIRRILDRAAFRAAQDGAVVVAGETRPETVAALLAWAVEGRASSVAMAPLTAVLAAP
jgi:polysaccharide deacetylase 2 family uncharacterized protein YibQ